MTATPAARPRDIRPSIAVEDVTVRYSNGVTAVEGASFALGPGTICALVGVNGSGKSTLFKSLMGFVRPAAGAIAFAASANVITDVNPVLALACGLLVAGSVHTVKAAAVRPAVTATTGGAGNIPVSIAEDIIAFLSSVLAIMIPIVMGTILIVLFAFIIWWWMRRTQKSQTV